MMEPVMSSELDARVTAVAYLSQMRALADRAESALEEGCPGSYPLMLAADLRPNSLRKNLDERADSLMEPYGVANVLQTVEEYIANGTRIPSADVDTMGDYRRRIVRGLITAREQAREDEVAS